jgi:hypothetical protein
MDRAYNESVKADNRWRAAMREYNRLRDESEKGVWVEEWAAWLHDSIEDTDTTYHDLLILEVPVLVADIVQFMTHDKRVTNEDYWTQIAQSPARLVKLCDIADNLNPERLCRLPEETQNRLRKKYGRALIVLSGG